MSESCHRSQYFSGLLRFRILCVTLHYLPLMTACPDGGIGRRDGLKHRWSNPSRFDPGSGYPSRDLSSDSSRPLIYSHSFHLHHTQSQVPMSDTPQSLLDAEMLTSRIAVCSNLFSLFGGFWIFECGLKYLWIPLVFSACVGSTYCISRKCTKGRSVSLLSYKTPILFFLFAQLIATALIAIVHSVPVYAGLAITFPLSAILWVRHAGKRR